MVTIELENKENEKKEFPKYLLERTLTIGEVTDVTSWSGTKTKILKDKTIKEVKSEKIILTTKVGDKIINCWMNADVKKGSEPTYNTQSYTNLENLGLLENFKQEVQKAVEQKIQIDLPFVENYFRNKLKGKKIKFVPETIPTKDGDKYSVIQIIEGFAWVMLLMRSGRLKKPATGKNTF